jgi:predicted dehydrogenase
MMRLPASRVPDPALAPPLNWGILGTGWIAARFADALTRLSPHRVEAVGSRSPETARDFAARHGIGRAYGRYPDLVGDPGIDVVYIATPHTHHLPHARLALEAGKHVLVEKPIGLDAAQAREIAGLAAERGLFCAEAMWTLYLPKFDVIRQVLDEAMLGEVHTVLADHGEWFTADHRIMRTDLAGGPLLDLGTYPVALAGWALGAPNGVLARGQAAPNGINGQVSALLTWATGAQALLHTTILSNTPTAATIAGSAGSLHVPGVFFRPGGFALTSADRSEHLRYDEPASGYDGLVYEAAEVARQIAAGATETPVRPMADAVATLAVIDEIRRQIGIAFPGAGIPLR